MWKAFPWGNKQRYLPMLGAVKRCMNCLRPPGPMVRYHLKQLRSYKKAIEAMEQTQYREINHALNGRTSRALASQRGRSMLYSCGWTGQLCDAMLWSQATDWTTWLKVQASGSTRSTAKAMSTSVPTLSCPAIVFAYSIG